MTFPIISPITPSSISTKPLTSATGIVGNWTASSPAILKNPFPDFKTQPLPSKDTSISSLPAHSLNILLTRTAGRTILPSPTLSLAKSVYLTNTSKSVAVNSTFLSWTPNFIPCKTCLMVEDGTIPATRLKPLYNSFFGRDVMCLLPCKKYVDKLQKETSFLLQF